MWGEWGPVTVNDVGLWQEEQRWKRTCLCTMRLAL